MTRVFIRHKIKNYAKWRVVFDAFKKTRKAGGEKSFKIGHAAGQPNNLCLLFTWESVDKAKAFLRSKELKAAMQEAGVREKPEIHIFEDKA
jgi:quinol monooxygenase YgiN